MPNYDQHDQYQYDQRKYIKQLIHSLPITNNLNTNKLNTNNLNSNNPIPIDIVLDGGAFAGSLHVGALYYLKQLQKNNIIDIQRLSGVSIGSAIALLFKLNALHLSSHIYKFIQNCFKDNISLDISFQIIAFMKQLMDDKDPHFYKSLNDNFFVSYIDIKLNKHIAVSTYDSNFHVCDTIIKSMFIPFLFDGSISYRNQFIDGITPHFFYNQSPKKTLFIDLSQFPVHHFCTKFSYDFSSNKRKAIDDIHSFFTHQKNTPMCSFVENWDFLSQLRFKLRYIFTIAIAFVFSYIHYFYNYFSIHYSVFFQNNESLLKIQSYFSHIFQIIVRNLLV